MRILVAVLVVSAVVVIIKEIVLQSTINDTIGRLKKSGLMAKMAKAKAEGKF